jgi:hypothetical protein
LNGKYCLTVGAFYSGFISEALHPKDITKVYSIFILTGWARAVCNFFVRKNQIFCDDFGSIVDKRETKCV